MKKKQLCRTLTAAAVLAAAMAIPAFASGWEQTTDGTWVYTDSSGNYVTDSWKKSGDYYFYLGDDGTLVTDSLIEDDGYYYYVDENGAMVTNRWVKLESTDDDDTDADYRWYYFGANGRAYQDTSSPKEINGKKYMFDEEGRMLYGFVNEEGEMLTDEDAALDATYYFGTADDGTMHTGWLQVTEDLTDESYDDYDEIWMYFGSNGEKYADSTKTINGSKYSFDENGIMNYGLAAVSSSFFAALYSAFGRYDVVHIHAEGPAFFTWLPKMFGKRVVVFSAIKAIGAILLGLVIVQIGLALKSHDAGQRAQGFMTFFGGVVIYFAKDILDMIL